MTREEFIRRAQDLIRQTPAEEMPDEFWMQVEELERAEEVGDE